MGTNLTIAAVTRVSGRTRKTIENWVRNGKISSIKSGSKTVISVAEVTRVFPYVSIDSINAELANDGSHIVVPQNTNPPSDFEAERIKLLNQIDILNQKISNLEEVIATKNSTIEMLQEMVNFLKEQHAKVLLIADRLSVPAIPQKSGFKRSGGDVRPRDPETGQFIKKTGN